MDKTLGQALIKRNIRKQDTEVDAWHSATAFGGMGTVDNVGSFTINNIEVDDGTPIFNARSNVDGQWEKITMDKVVSVDGMEPNKLAEAYGIKKKGKKRK